MPKIQSFSCTNGAIMIDGQSVFTAAVIPVSVKTMADLETHLNQVFAPTLNKDYQIQFHVFSMTPLQVTAATANQGVIIQPNWWLTPPDTDPVVITPSL